MKINTPEISWHAKEAIYSVDIQAKQENQPLRVATAGIDSNVRIWELKPDSKAGVTFLSNLLRHDKAVNVVRFSKSGKVLASGGDDGTIVLWKLSDKNEAPNIFDDASEIGKNIETWTALKVLRGHLEDVNDLCWSPDEKYIISGSIDHTAMLWDVGKGMKICIMSEAKHYIHGVAYDPLGQYAAVMSCDRSLRIYSIQSKRVLHNISKMVYPEPEELNDDMQVDEEDAPSVKSQRMFHDESVVRRRLEFTCDGNLLIVPSGCLTKKQGDQPEQINSAYVFARGCLSKPLVVLPGFKQPVTVIRCCPVKFHLRGDSPSAISLPYRLVFAVASVDTLLLYDTQCLEPFVLVGNIHYAAISDVTWSCDGRKLVISSRDGFCTIVQFEENELGEVLTEIVPTSKEENTENIRDEIQNSAESKTSENNIDSTMKLIENSKSAEQAPNAQQGDSAGNGDSVEANEDCLGKGQDVESCVTETKEHNSDQSKDTGRNLQESSGFSASSQEKTPRRIQLTTVSDSPGTKTPRRVQLTAIASPKTDSSKAKTTPSKTLNQDTPSHSLPSVSTPKSAFRAKSILASGSGEKTPRRIQLTPVND